MAWRPEGRIPTFIGAAALLAACACAPARAAVGIGACTAPGVQGGALFGAGGASGLLEALSGVANGPASCLPVEPASQPVDAPARVAGNPVDLLTGEKVDRAVDLRVVRPTGVDAGATAWVFSRFYGSASPGSRALGPGWRHGFETRLHVSAGSDGRRTLLVVQADGRTVTFRPSGDGAADAALAADSGDGELRRASGSVEDDHAAWTWRWRSGRVLVFADDGRLTRVVGEDGVEIALGYDAAGRLVTLADTGARTLNLEYGHPSGRAGPERLLRVRGPGAASVDYRYDGSGRLAGAVREDGRWVAFRYADPVSARLAELRFPDGRSSAYLYDHGNRVVWSRPAGGGPEMRFAYRWAADGTGETTVSLDGVERAGYRWREFPEGRRIVEAQGPGCEGCPPTGLRYGYDEGRLAWAEAGAQRWTLTRDRRGRVAEVRRRDVDAPEGAGRVVLSMRWDDATAADRLLGMVRPSAFGNREARFGFSYAPDGRLASVRRQGWSPVVTSDRGGARRVGLRPIDERFAAAPDPMSDGSLPENAIPDSDGTFRVTAPNGVTTRHWLDDFGRVTAIFSPDSGLALKAYDDRGRLSAEVAADGTAAAYRYTSEGLLREKVLSTRDGRRVVTRLRHADGRLTQVEHPERSEDYAYDAQGRLAARTVRLRLSSGRERAVTVAYRRAAATGEVVAHTLADGSWLHLDRGPGGQVVGLRRVAFSARGGAVGSGVHDGDSAPLLDGLVRDRHGLTGARFANGVAMAVARDPQGRPSAICHGFGPQDCTVLDHRLHFDPGGALVSWRRGATDARFLHDARGALVQAVIDASPRSTVLRYAYDANGNRLLAAQGHRGAPVTKLQRAPGSNRVATPPGRSDASAAGADADTPVWDAAGRLLVQGGRRYRWSAEGLLERVEEGGRVVARYRYNHRGERVAKWTPAGWRHFLHDESRRVVAEFDDAGRIRRQYLHLADLPVAVLDHRSDGERLAFLHLNHLGAPEAATDMSGRVLWRAAYLPFGRRIPVQGQDADPSFDHPLRLPGQYEDAETGLHHNDHRYYDPDAGRYLSPDPLGLRAGSNPYAYAANDPLARVDPTGLLLFAFDGTNNSANPPGRDDWSNVYKLSRSYADGRVWYVSGVGTADPSGIVGGAFDALTAGTARARVDHMLAQLDLFAAAPSARGRWFDVDVIGFSRGAAMGRDFANRVADRIGSGAYRSLGACLRLRFLGLWDTVAQFGLNGATDLAWRLSVPASVAYAAHAVALNEHRLLFPAESIAGSPLGGVRIERGFVGAHADVGGSYAEGDLSDVALGWMHAQARLAGVRMLALTSEFARVTSPLLHDSGTSGFGDREFRKRGAWGVIVSNQWQRLARVDGLAWRDTAQFIDRYERPRADAYGEPTLAGEVDMADYAAWLRANYGFEVAAGP